MVGLWRWEMISNASRLSRSDRAIHAILITRQARVAARFEGTPPADPQGAPRLGEHNRQILAELGYSEDEIDDLRDAGAIGREAYSE